MSLSNTRPASSLFAEEWVKLMQFWRLVRAVLLRDMRSRYGTSYLGYLVAILWPLSHMGILTGMYFVRTKIAPVGDSPTLFAATGVAPYILCVYPARTMSMTIAQNRQLLNIPALKPFHLICSRGMLEVLNAVVILAIFMFALYMLDVEVTPVDSVEAAKAVSAAIFLGVGMGTLNVAMCAIFGNYFRVFFLLFMICLYGLSGIFVPVRSMPDELQEYVEYNPLLHIVEWLRSAYYASFDTEMINKTLVLAVAGVCLLLGLLGERYVRGKFFS